MFIADEHYVIFGFDVFFLFRLSLLESSGRSEQRRRPKRAFRDASNAYTIQLQLHSDYAWFLAFSLLYLLKLLNVYEQQVWV